jgi:hypothetical protein
MARVLQLLAPYLAVAVFWCGLENAWWAILAYHAQILFWSRHRLGAPLKGWQAQSLLLFMLGPLLAGPATYALLPFLAGSMSVGDWLTRFGLVGPALGWMIPYFGVVHPILEQAHWSELRRTSRWAHLAFAGYHALVLVSLVNPAGLVFCVGVLYGTSWCWAHLQSRTGGGLVVPVCTHVAADLGIILAAALRAGWRM